MRLFYKIAGVSILLWAAALASAQTLTGTVTNGTTNKPAAGDDVVLLKLANGMEEGGRTKTDSQGKFSFKLDDGDNPHLIRAIHQGVTYHRMAPPGTTSVEVQVFDASKKIEGLSVTADVMRFQAQGDQIQGVRLFAVDNNSNPPRTQMNDQNFEFYLPDGAQVDTALAKTAGGQPVNSTPVPQKEKNRFAFIFPLRPGETQFQVVYHLPYKGELSIDPRPLYAAQHFVVMVPKTMQFSAQGGGFQAMDDPQQSSALVEVASNTTLGQPLAFKISGTGLLPEGGPGGQDNAGGGSGGNSQAVGGAQVSGRPGGGLGPPIEAPDPLDKYRWYILGGFAIVLAAGAIYISGRSKSVPVADYSDIEAELPVPPPTRAAAPTARLQHVARGAEGRTLSTGTRSQARTHLARGVRQGQGRARPDPGARPQAGNPKSVAPAMGGWASRPPLRIHRPAIASNCQ